MNANIKSTMDETLQAICDPVAYATLCHTGFERAVEASKIGLNLAAQQNNDIVAAIKKALKGTSLNLSGLDLFSQAVEGYIAIQKSLLDMALDQSASILESIGECVLDNSKAKTELANIMQQTVDRSLNAQNTVVEFASKQTKALHENLKSQPGIAGTPVEAVSDTIQRGFDTVISAQKEIMSIAAKPLKAVAQA
jgi:hypothetical protein